LFRESHFEPRIDWSWLRLYDFFGEFNVVLGQKLELSFKAFLFWFIVGDFFGNEQNDLSFEVLISDQIEFLVFPQTQNIVFIILDKILYMFLIDWFVRKPAFVVQIASIFKMMKLAWVVLSVVGKIAGWSFGACIRQEKPANDLNRPMCTLELSG
jgi:hypothetical protein